MVRKISIGMAGVLFCGFMAGEALAARPGGTFHFCAPYGGDLLTLDPHKGTRTNDMLVMLNLNRSLYSWDPEKNRPRLVGCYAATSLAQPPRPDRRGRCCPCRCPCCGEADLFA